MAPPEPPSKDGSPLVERNMFCSSCEAKPAGGVEPVASVANGEATRTSLPLALVATNVSTDAESSFASIMNTQTTHKGAYWLGQTIPGAGRIESIAGRHVDFVNVATGRLERIVFSDAPTTSAPSSHSVSRAAPPPRDAFEAKLESGVRDLGNNRYELDRSLVDEVTRNPTMVKGGFARPAVKDGQMIGMRISAVRPGSAYDRLGLKNGDILRSVNGFDLTTPDKMLEAYTKLRTASSLALQIDRRGEPVQLHYKVL
jgi:general secretion pathway protein C